MVLSLDVVDAELPPEAKRFYFRPRSQADLGRSYLLALARRMELKSEGILEIEHGAKAAYYVELLKTSTNRAPQNPMIDDTVDFAAIETASAAHDWLAEELEEAIALEEKVSQEEEEEEEEPQTDDVDDICEGSLPPAQPLRPLPTAKGRAVARSRGPPRKPPHQLAEPASSGKAIFWGLFRFLHVIRGDVHMFECTCPYHNDPGDKPSTRRKKSKTWDDDSEASYEKALLQLKSWCLAGRSKTNRRAGDGHLKCPVDIAGTAEELDIALAAALSESHWVLGDARGQSSPSPSGGSSSSGASSSGDSGDLSTSE